jgi:uncharacterized delta-60 repeat protein
MKKIYFLLISFLTNIIAFGQAGQVDPSFVCGYSDFYYNNADIQSDEKLLVSRGITDPASGSIGHTIHRFLDNGNDDNTFNKPYATGSFYETNYDRLGILAIKVLSDDRIMVGGVFSDIRNSGQPSSPCVNLARLLPNGDIDPTFQFNLETYLEAVTTIFVNSEDEVIIGGDRTFSRIFEDGSIDESFGDNFFKYFNTIETIDQFSNGKYLVGGDLTVVYNSYLMRLLPDGNPDSSWDTGTGFNGKVTKVIIQPDQKILVIGSFSQFNGTPANRICRLNEDGTFDTSFDIGTGPNGAAILSDMILQPDGKIIIAGRLIYSFNGHNRQATVRLNSDGSVDTSYGETGYIRYDSQYPGIIRSLLQLPNSRIIAAGYFFNFRFFSGASFSSIGVMRLFNCTNSTETQTINACDNYTWIDGNTYYESNNTATYTYTGSEGCNITASLNLTITPSVTISNTDSTLTANLSDATYQWVDCNNGNSPISGETNQSFSPTEAGNYAVEVTLNGCTSTSDCIEITTLGLSEIEKADFINMYPNPSNNIVNIQTIESIALIEVYDIQGKLIIYKNSDFTTINVTELSKGFYIVKFNFENGKTISKRLSKF